MPSSAATLAEVCLSRAAFVQHVPQYGCVLSDEKMQAVLAGDLSGLIVHPAFTYLAQLLGCLMWQIQRQMFMFPQVEYEQLQLLLLALFYLVQLSSRTLALTETSPTSTLSAINPP